MDKIDMKNKAEREACWNAKDKFLECMDVNSDKDKCTALRDEFEKKCPSSWVMHFIAKNERDKFEEEKDLPNQRDTEFALIDSLPDVEQSQSAGVGME